jgi:trimethylamine--corrinoid protein Co-methyltransferase
MAHFREHWYPKLFERGDYGEWQAQGSKSLGERASERVGEILAEHKPQPLPQDVACRIRGIAQRAVGDDWDG